MANEPNGRAKWMLTVLAVVASVLLTGGIWEARTNSVAHETIMMTVSEAQIDCILERGADRERVRALEGAIFRIDENVADIKRTIERIGP
jgi:hypothetical protein